MTNLTTEIIDINNNIITLSKKDGYWNYKLNRYEINKYRYILEELNTRKQNKWQTLAFAEFERVNDKFLSLKSIYL